MKTNQRLIVLKKIYEVVFKSGLKDQRTQKLDIKLTKEKKIQGYFLEFFMTTKNKQLLPKAKQKYAPIKNSFHMVVTHQEDVEAMIEKLSTLKKKLPRLNKKCEQCHCIDASVDTVIDPYHQEINQEEIIVDLCSHCYQQKLQDI